MRINTNNMEKGNNASNFTVANLDKNGSEFNNLNHEYETTIENSTKAQNYLDHLLNNGCNEGDSGYEMEMPPYYNEKLFKQGQSYLHKYRFVLHGGMLAGLVAALAVPSILKILNCTRQTSSPAIAYRRYVRTIQHTVAWYKYSPTPKTSKFWISLKAVRKAHSRSSRLCAKLAAGQITQKDLAITQFAYIGFLTLGAHRIQIHDEDFLESTSHMWRVLGYLLGIKDEYNICGENWCETKERLDIVMRKIVEPALENSNKDYERICKALLESLQPVITGLTVDSFLYMTKRVAYVKGYEYYDFDYRPGTKPDPDQHRYYKNLSWWDRFIVFHTLMLLTYLHKYSLVRWLLNLRVWFDEQLMYYMPYIAILKYGIKWSYVRIFTGNSANSFDFNLNQD